MQSERPRRMVYGPADSFWTRNKIGILIILGFLGAQLVAESLFDLFGPYITTILLVVSGVVTYALAGQLKAGRRALQQYGMQLVERTPLDSAPIPERSRRAIRLVFDVVGSVFIVSVLFFWFFSTDYFSSEIQLLIGVVILTSVGMFAMADG